jgi:multidrug resistance protein
MKKSIFILFPILLIIYDLAVNLSNDMYLPAVSLMIEYFKVNPYLIQMTLTAWFAGALLLNPVLGILSDYFGQKKILLYCGFLFLIATLYCAMPNNLYLFMIMRFFQGFAATSVVVCGYGLIHEIYDNKQAILITAWLSGALVIAPMLGPLLGGSVIYFLNWHFVFYILAFVASITLISLYFFMPAQIATEQKPKFSLKQEFLDYKNILANKTFLMTSLIYAILFGALITWITVSPFMIIETYHFSPLQFGFLQIPIFGSYILGVLVLKLFFKVNITENRIISIGMILFFLLLLCMFAMLHQVNLALLIVFYSIFSFNYGLIASVLNRHAVTAVEFGMGKVMATFDFIAGIIATTATIALNAHTDNIIFWLSVALMLFVFLALAFYLSFNKLKIGALSEKSISA